MQESLKSVFADTHFYESDLSHEKSEIRVG